jgi:hypothetical protein
MHTIMKVAHNYEAGCMDQDAMGNELKKMKN